ENPIARQTDGAGAACGDAGVLEEQRTSHGLSTLFGEWRVRRLGSDGVRMHDGGGPKAEIERHALVRRRHGRNVPTAGTLSKRPQTMGALLGSKNPAVNMRSTN